MTAPGAIIRCLISLANTAEPLYLVNRSGNRPSHEQADVFLDKAVDLCREAGFRKITPAGRHRVHARPSTSTAGTSTGYVRFIFGFDATTTLKDLADDLPAEAYSFLERPPRYEIKTAPRSSPNGSSRRSSSERGFKTIHLLEEMVAEFDYRPVACKRELSGDRAPQAAGDRQGAIAAVRGVSLLLLHHQRPRQ